MTGLLKLGHGPSWPSLIGAKAGNLDVARRRGLDVPESILIPAEVLDDLLAEGLVRDDGRRVNVEDAEALHARLGIEGLKDVAIRSAFSAEDGTQSSLAGAFESVLDVDAKDPDALAAALSTVWSSAARVEGSFRRDVLIMAMVAARHAGVAFLEDEFEDDRVEWTDGTAQDLVGGREAGQALELPRRRRGETARVSDDSPPFAVRLQALLKGLREVFPGEDLDAEWADDGASCRLIQARPITAATLRNETFTLANHREILPDLPSRIMTGVIAECAAELFEYYRRFDPTLPERRPFIEVFAGRPLINLSLLTEMMRRLGLPTRLVTDSIGGADSHPFSASPRRLLRKLPVLIRMGLAQMRSPNSAQRTANRLARDDGREASSFGELLHVFSRSYVDTVHEMMSLTAAMSGPVAMLRRFGVLARHIARQRTEAVTALEDLHELRAHTASDTACRTACAAGELPQDETFQSLWQSWLDRHGHRGVFESDIAQPRFRDEPAPILRAIAEPEPQTSGPSRLGLSGLATLPLWWQASRAMRAREHLRWAAMRGTAALRDRFLELGEVAVREGRLPHANDVFLLTPDELRAVDDGAVVTEERIDAIRSERAELAPVRLPAQIRRFDDLEPSASRVNGQSVRGVGLVDGIVNGSVWAPAGPSEPRPSSMEKDSTILVAPAIDAGWIAVFQQVAGVIVEIGGELSHGSIILRELSMPSVTNAAGATDIFQTGDHVRLDARRGVAQRAGA